MRHAMPIALWMMTAALPVLAAEREGAVGGRLVILDSGEPLSLREAEKEIGGDPISIEVRAGAEVFEATLRPDGLFVVRAPPGRYRLEYLRVGERAEFLQPQVLEIADDTLTCAGTLRVDTGYIENLGANQQSTVELTDDCAELTPLLQRFAGPASRTQVRLPRPGPVLESVEGYSFLERLGAVRLEFGATTVLALRVTYQHYMAVQYQPFLGAIIHASAGQMLPYLLVEPDTLMGKELLGGGGLHMFGFDAIAYAGTRHYPAPIGTVLVGGGLVRMNLGTLAVGARLEVLPFVSWGVFVDFSPVSFVGGLL